jgi:hypothetical protein
MSGDGDVLILILAGVLAVGALCVDLGMRGYTADGWGISARWRLRGWLGWLTGAFVLALGLLLIYAVIAVLGAISGKWDIMPRFISF